VLPGFKRVWGPAVHRDDLSLNPHAVVFTGADSDAVTGAMLSISDDSMPYFERREKAYYFSYPQVRTGSSWSRAITFESRAPVAYDVPVYVSYTATVACGLIELLGEHEGELEFRRSMVEHYRLIDDVEAGSSVVYQRWNLLSRHQQKIGLALLRRAAQV